MLRYPYPPGAHQLEACQSIVGELKTQPAATAILPCGTGKTFLAAMVDEALRPQTTVLFFPSIALIRQTLLFWRSTGALEGGACLCVCSDQTVASNDDVVVTEAELGMHVSTSPADIRARVGALSGRWFIFCTYHSASVLAAGLPPGAKLDLGIFDEAHRTASEVASDFSFALSDANLKIAKRVFMTATPRHSSLGSDDPDGFTMDNTEVYGQQVYTLPMREAIDRGLICDYKVIVSAVTSREVHSALTRKIRRATTTAVARDVILSVAMSIRKAMEVTGAKKLFSFHRTVASAAAFASDPDVLREIGCKVFHVSGEMTAKRREAVLRKFEAADRAVMTNARCLTEGIDVPSVDMVVFPDTKNSVIDIVQAVGRTLRLALDKTHGYVLLPAMVSEGAVTEAGGALVAESRLRTIWQVLSRMAEQESVIAYRNDASKADVRKAHRDRVAFSVIGGSDAADALREAIEVFYASKTFSGFDVNFDILKAFKEKTGSANPVASQLPELAAWLRYLRYAYNLGSLSFEHVQRLDSIGFHWNGRDAAWEDQYAKFIAGKPSARWVARQRADYRAGKLSADREAKLVAGKFIFAPTIGRPSEGRPPLPGRTTISSPLPLMAKYDEEWDKRFHGKALSRESVVVARAAGIPAHRLLSVGFERALRDFFHFIFKVKPSPLPDFQVEFLRGLSLDDADLVAYLFRLKVSNRVRYQPPLDLYAMNGVCCEGPGDGVVDIAEGHLFPLDAFDQRRPRKEVQEDILARVKRGANTEIPLVSNNLDTWLLAVTWVANAVADDMGVGAAYVNAWQQQAAKRARDCRLSVQLPNGNWLRHDSGLAYRRQGD